MVDLINKVNYQELAKQVLDKFIAISTDFIGDDGRRDSMANRASAMRMMIAGYERQISEIQEPLHSAAMSASGGHANSAGATMDACEQEVGDGDDTFDMDFGWDSVGNTFWDGVLENFTIIP